MSQINVDTIVDKAGTGAPDFSNGLTVTGVITATSLNQNVSGIITATTFEGDLSSSGISTVGILTAWTSVTVSTGATIESSGAAQFAGIVTASSYYGDGSTLTNAGVTFGKAMGLAAFLGS